MTARSGTPTSATPLERRCRRLLALYPARHRRVHEDEMVGVLLASARDGQRHLPPRDAADLVAGAARIWLRRAGRLPNPRGRAALELLSVLAPVLLCAESLANSGLIGRAWLALGGRMPAWYNRDHIMDRSINPVRVVPIARPGDFWVLVAAGPVVLGLVLLGRRRTAGLAALLVTGAAVAIAEPSSPSSAYWLAGLDPTVTLTGWTSLLAAIALLSAGPPPGLPAGPARRPRLPRRPAATLAGLWLLALVLLVLGRDVEVPTPHGLFGLYNLIGPAPEASLTALALIGVATCWCLRSAAGRRMLLVLAVPLFVYAEPLLAQLFLLDGHRFVVLDRFLVPDSLTRLGPYLLASLAVVLVPRPRRFRRERWRAEASR